MSSRTVWSSTERREYEEISRRVKAERTGAPCDSAEYSQKALTQGSNASSRLSTFCLDETLAINVNDAEPSSSSIAASPQNTRGVLKRVPERDTPNATLDVWVEKKRSREVPPPRPVFVRTPEHVDDEEEDENHTPNDQATSPKSGRKIVIPTVELVTMQTELAEKDLDRTLKKQDFADLKILGQFNLGFIIAAHNTGPTEEELRAVNKFGFWHGHLLLIDQHASDEKYNYEMLQKNTVISNQPLVMYVLIYRLLCWIIANGWQNRFRPQTLTVSPVHEAMAISHMDILEKNGFGIRVNENNAPGQRLVLCSQPMYGNVALNHSGLCGEPISTRLIC